jgi:hypothetical protein
MEQIYVIPSSKDYLMLSIPTLSRKELKIVQDVLYVCKNRSYVRTETDV